MSATKILLVEDDTALRGALAETLTLANYEVCEASDGHAALRVLADQDVAAVVSDYQMEPMDGYELLIKLRETRPDLPVFLMTAHGTIQHAVKTIQQGATDYLVKPFEALVLLEKLEGVLPKASKRADMIAVDAATRRILAIAEKLAPSDATVLLSGESGTGKEVFARYIHHHSRRADMPFVAVNCAAIPENMLEATLFGHEKGAFTGAHVARPGKFELAQGGTLLLDEISEIELSLQAKLLRVLQEKEVERVGARNSIPLDVRVLATTNRDLPDCVKRGRFREDLYYRLSVLPLHLPPLRSRRNDILPLARHFLESACDGLRLAPTFSSDAEEYLIRYDWPGNVRELQNLIDRALVLSDGAEIRSSDLHFESLDGSAPLTALSPSRVPSSQLKSNLRTVEDQLVIDALEECGGNRKQTAQRLGVSARTLRYKIAKLKQGGLEVPGQRNRAESSD